MLWILERATAVGHTRILPPTDMRAVLIRFTRDYIHRVGRTARAGRGGSAVSLITQVYLHVCLL